MQRKECSGLYTLELEAYLELKLGTSLYRRYRKKVDAIALPQIPVDAHSIAEFERVNGKYFKRSAKLAKELGITAHLDWYTWARVRNEASSDYPLPEAESPEIRAKLFAIAKHKKAQFYGPALFCLAALFTAQYERESNHESN